MLKTVSVLCFALMVAGLAGLLIGQSLFAQGPLGISAQVAAVALMVWARITFGRRSFSRRRGSNRRRTGHLRPYAFFRHPIYTAVCLFCLAGALTYRTPAAFGWLVLVFAGAIGRDAV
jgi:protein-S-isoprenylcysteine O-methyltransferase Ste14